MGGQFLSLLTGKEPSEEHARFLDVSLILYAEHGSMLLLLQPEYVPQPFLICILV